MALNGGFEVQHVGDTMRIIVKGNLTFNDSDHVQKLAKSIVTQRRVEVDLSAIDILDSTSLGLLLILKKSLADPQIPIKLVGLSDELKRMLQIAAFQQLFEWD
uniref:Putative anti-sigma-factor antagonist n=1 Tax=Magnetococcus massalia (strain MO-1) TaxID=451514 RepID=A0A1S7LCZ2_MAGMO|nr:Putative anti-sigma-factor antagonist [Candidatus Magnetococcus massalia]